MLLWMSSYLCQWAQLRFTCMLLLVAGNCTIACFQALCGKGLLSLAMGSISVSEIPDSATAAWVCGKGGQFWTGVGSLLNAPHIMPNSLTPMWYSSKTSSGFLCFHSFIPFILVALCLRLFSGMEKEQWELEGRGEGAWGSGSWVCFLSIGERLRSRSDGGLESQAESCKV